MVIFNIGPEEAKEFQPELSAYYKAQSDLFARIVYQRRLGRARSNNPADMVFDLLENTVCWGFDQFVRFAGFTVDVVMAALPKLWQKIKRTEVKKVLQQPSRTLGEVLVGFSEVLRKAGCNLLRSKKTR